MNERTREIENGGTSVDQMVTKQLSIPPHERCEECNGYGKVPVGAAVKYKTCTPCLGTGRKNN